MRAASRGRSTWARHDLAAPATATREATLDCTGGWFTVQQWTGVPLAELLARPAPTAGPPPCAWSASRATRGASRCTDAGDLLLATHVAGEPLDHGHGAPLRLVVPGRRGFDWVKWIVAIEVDDTPAWWQSPLPLS